MKKIVSGITFIVLSLVFSSFTALADPTTAPVHITQIRPYNTQGASCGVVYIAVDQTLACNTNVFQIDLCFGGGKEVYAAALTAFAASKAVQVEVVNSGCTGWGTKIQSLFMNN
ncbi:MAG: hypothetical protein HY080_07320 [Gammaproteobacteria bacterium]|nr:hypothetical protein [Gammaproteobacteria bacterium]